MKSRGCIIAAVAGGAVIVVLLGLVMWGVGIYNGLVRSDEAVRSDWAQVESQYQRRADLIPNLVSTVKGYAQQEKDVLLGVTEARARVGQMAVTKDVLEDPNAFARFQAAQDGLSSALSRLLVVAENYPQLKSDQNFRDLQVQLEGTENRIQVARQRFNTTVQAYNTQVRTFPTAMIAGFTGFQEKAYFQSKAGSENAPEVKF